MIPIEIPSTVSPRNRSRPVAPIGALGAEAIMEVRWLKLKDACAYAGVSRNTLKRMLERGDISGGTTPGGHRRIDRESLDAWFKRGEAKIKRIMAGIRV